MYMINRPVRTELVEVQILARPNGGKDVPGLASQVLCSIRKFAALPFDRLRANGSLIELVVDK